MKNLPFEKSKCRLLWKFILHAIEVIIFPGVPILTACVQLRLFDRKVVDRTGLALIIVGVMLATYVLRFYIGRLRVLPEISDKRRRFKYITIGIVDSVPWCGVAAFLGIAYGALKTAAEEAEKTAGMIGNLFSSALLLILVFSLCKLADVWLNALLIKYLDVVDEDAERGYLLAKAFDYGGLNEKKK